MTPAVTSFHSQLPVKIAFGDGVIAELPAVLAALGAVERARRSSRSRSPSTPTSATRSRVPPRRAFAMSGTSRGQASRRLRWPTNSRSARATRAWTRSSGSAGDRRSTSRRLRGSSPTRAGRRRTTPTARAFPRCPASPSSSARRPPGPEARSRARASSRTRSATARSASATRTCARSTPSSIPC